MCLKLNTCLNARQDEVHNPLNMVFSCCTWSLVSENTYCHRASHNTLPVSSLWHSFQAIRPWVHGEDDFSACWKCRPPAALFAGCAAEYAVLRRKYVLAERFVTNAFQSILKLMEYSHQHFFFFFRASLFVLTNLRKTSQLSSSYIGLAS